MVLCLAFVSVTIICDAFFSRSLRAVLVFSKFK